MWHVAGEGLNPTSMPCPLHSLGCCKNGYNSGSGLQERSLGKMDGSKCKVDFGLCPRRGSVGAQGRSC